MCETHACGPRLPMMSEKGISKFRKRRNENENLDI